MTSRDMGEQRPGIPEFQGRQALQDGLVLSHIRYAVSHGKNYRWS